MPAAYNCDDNDIRNDEVNVVDDNGDNYNDGII
jgi:hypothetical protein